MTMASTLLAVILSAGLPAQSDSAPVSPPVTPPIERAQLAQSISVELRTNRPTVPAGSEVIVEFVAQNRTAEPVTLFVPGTIPGKEKYQGMGLPLEHVFSGPNYRGLEIVSDAGAVVGDRVTRKPEFPVPPITLAPFGTVGLRFDVSRFYAGLRQPGVYTLRWQPYGGAAVSNTLTIKVVQLKQVIMDTDQGTITLRMLYDKAPKTVDNFLDLVNQKFYNGKTFHEVRKNLCILGGCPHGDGTGKRPDGATIDPEFNDTAFEAGTVAMSLAEPDEHSASCQFFISLARQPKWDGRYTAFAQAEGAESIATLRRIADLPTDADGRPTRPVRIKSMSVSDAPMSTVTSALP